MSTRLNSERNEGVDQRFANITMSLITETYAKQILRWPKKGRHILAQFDDSSIIVYQAYRPEIGHFAARNGYFGGEFSLSRMSWIKPNFLWMMHRSGWGRKPGQEVILAIRLKREGFDNILAQAVHSSFVPGIYKDNQNWQEALLSSTVRLQWDPDHDPSGKKLERRAIQLGLRGEALERYSQEWIVEIEDISEFVSSQYQFINSKDHHQLVTPKEEVYKVQDVELAKRLQLFGVGA